MTRKLLCFAAAALAVLVLAAPAVADDVIYRGTDGWKTVTSTYTTFAQDPIPADFFCPGSAPFTGRIDLRGVPIATDPAGALDGEDTLIGRLDDAVFNAEGVARTPISLIALNLESIEPFDTGCGLYTLHVVLDKEQPTTEMTITRTAVGGGTFEAPLALNTLAIFTPAEGGDGLVLKRRIDLGPGSKSVWIETERPEEPKMVRVDTDGDGVPDRDLALRSNFRAGIAPAATGITPVPAQCQDVTCHCTRGSTDPNEPNWYCEHLHCQEVWIPCSMFPLKQIRGPVQHEPVGETSG